MKLQEIAKKIGAHIAASGTEREITDVYAGDRISDLIEQATPHTLLVTNIANAQLIRVAELMDTPGICLVNAAVPAAELLQAAAKNGTGIMVSADGLFQTCAMLYLALHPEKGGRS